MSIAVVLSVTGQAWARDAEGNLRELRPGDVLQEGEVVITSDDGSVDLDFGGGEAGLVVIEPGQEVLMQAELVPGAEVDAEQASVQDDEVEALLAALEDDDIDLLDILEDTAAGAGAGGDGAGGGHGFIRLARITEGVDPLNYQYGVGLAGGPEGGLGEPQLLEEESLPTISVVDAEGGNQVDEAALDDGSNPGSPAESISGGFNITHSGDDTTASLVVGGVDVTNGGVVNGTYGTLTVTLNGGVYEWTYTLDDNTTDHPDNTSTGTSEGIQDVFSVTVTDSDGDTASTTLTIDVLDDGPIAVDDSVADEVPEDGSVDIDVFANDTAGADGVDLTTGIAVASGPSKGSVVYNGDGTFTYTADPGEEGVDSFTYTLTDSDGDTSTATVDLTIAPDSVPSISVVDAEGGNQVDEAALDDGSNPGSPAESVSGSFNITHSGDDTTASLVVGGVDVTNGGVVNGTYGTLTVTLNAGVYEWTYALDDNTTDHPDDTSTGTSEGIQDVFSVTVTDSDGDTDDTSLTIDVLDDGPIAVDDSVAGEVPEDGSVDIDVFANDTAGADGVDLTTGIAVASGPSKGSVIYNGDGTFTYTANPGEEGADSFTYTLTDGDGDTATATVNLTIAPDSVPSISVVDAEGGNQVDEAALDDGSNPGSPAESVSGSFNITHSGTDTTASLVVGGVDVTNGGVVNGTYGTLTVMLNAGVYEWTYTLDDNTTDHPDDTSTGTSEGIQDVFAVTVTDSDGDTDDTSLTIDVLDDGPVAVDESPSVLTEGDAAISGNLLTNDSEGADGATVTHVDVGSGFVTLGSGTDLGGGDFGFSVTGVGDYVFNADGSWSFTPADSVDNSSGDVDASFSYRITDGDGDTDEASKAI
ncbi:retention module-containing protein, partial [Halomonas salifodinae]